MDLQTVESAIQLAQDPTVMEGVKAVITIAGVIFGKSVALTATGVVGVVATGWCTLSAAASEFCARTETKDTKLYRVIEMFARNTGKAKNK